MTTKFSHTTILSVALLVGMLVIGSGCVADNFWVDLVGDVRGGTGSELGASIAALLKSFSGGLLP